MARKRASTTGCMALAAALISAGLILAAGDATAALKQRTFDSPEAAAEALVKAASEDNTKEMIGLFGPGSRPLVSSGDPVEDRNRREQFVKSYSEKHRFETGPDGKVILVVGNNEWPMAIPLVKSGDRWRFDTPEGKQEILCRRIGRNEMSAIQVILAIADAEREYSDRVREKTGQAEYAQTFMSKPGKADGLYWETAPGDKPSPLGPLVARATREGYTRAIGGTAPYHGYLYRLLKVQGSHAQGGAFSYVVDGRMIGGFAVVAYPAVYRSSGVRTFIVNYDGIVYDKDLGKNTRKLAASMTSYDPDETWKKEE